eukprot:CAMPEP_0117635202 /NCGR_PEP_ID=MMETSP0802-20121206/6086_1 /TAXON_ID=38833 /ORGANISM="Micromonas sp., Strain CCMP2099" /LENGTH=154 /DNA_ID=CAMNT_0005439889 /DNA_START=143 /DNA_END=603 /DNA_ORIENTATION=-
MPIVAITNKSRNRAPTKDAFGVPTSFFPRKNKYTKYGANPAWNSLVSMPGGILREAADPPDTLQASTARSITWFTGVTVVAVASTDCMTSTVSCVNGIARVLGVELRVDGGHRIQDVVFVPTRIANRSFRDAPRSALQAPDRVTSASSRFFQPR